LILFIDTNILLSFYHFTSEDLQQLEKLAVLVRQMKVTLLLPEQVVDEFERNRDGKIADALRRMGDDKLGGQFPHVSHQYPEYEQLRDLQKDYGKARAILMEKLAQAARDREFAADNTIAALFKAGTRIKRSSDIFNAAWTRHQVGNPPGKRDSIGDAVNWESLLSAGETDAELHLVAEDKDWASPLDPAQFNTYLQAEWASRFGAGVRFYERLSQFLSEHFPDIKLATELEKDLLIGSLAKSHHFDETHKILRQLSRLSDFTSTQLRDIVDAFVTNNQIYWIVTDQDVRGFIDSALAGREDDVPPEALEELRARIEEAES